MRWIRVDNSVRVQPKDGSYWDWKEEIGAACHGQCVYCAIGEARFGGIDNFHVEHFRPKSKFDDLIDTITNLYLACSICNRFKGDDWPNEPDPQLNTVSYADPSQHDYGSFLSIDMALHTVASDKTTGRYLVERLYLNRPQLLRERRLATVQQKVAHLAAVFKQANEALGPKAPSALSTLAAELVEVQGLLLQTLLAKPYHSKEVRRPDKGTGSLRSVATFEANKVPRQRKRTSRKRRAR